MEVVEARRKAKDVAVRIFLAGSIEMGKAKEWQQEVIDIFQDFNSNVLIFNPRAGDWDDTWEPVASNKMFRDQVEWELAGLEHADIILMYIQPDTKSPISLMELGLFARTGKMLVCCPEGFWRKGNVDVVCNEYNVEQVDTYDEFLLVCRSLAWEYAPAYSVTVSPAA